MRYELAQDRQLGKVATLDPWGQVKHMDTWLITKRTLLKQTKEFLKHGSLLNRKKKLDPLLYNITTIKVRL